MKKFIIAIFAIALFNACQKEDEPIQPISDASTFDTWILNEGGWGNNDAELSKLNSQTGEITNGVFAAQNGRGLGDVAQDLMQYGGKLYVTVWNSNTIEVVDPKTGKSIKQIGMGQRGPRYLLGHEGKVYVTCYDKTVVRIDTATLTLDEGACALSGMQPETLCLLNGKLYVANSWEYQGGNAVYDNTLSVVDLATFREEKKIEVGTNPTIVGVIDDNHLLLTCQGSDWENTLMTLDLSTETTQSLGVKATGCDLYQNKCYSYYQNWTTGETQLQCTNLSTMETTPISLAEAKLTSPYGIKVNPTTGNILITDALDYMSNGDVACITPTGKLLWTSETTTGPSKIVFVK